jgi:glycosyltransferase involved in cell wall biosynthesis
VIAFGEQTTTGPAGDTPLSILHAEFSANWGGQEFRVLEQMDWLRRAGHRVALACRPDCGMARRAAAAGHVCHPLVLRGVYNPVSLVRAAALAAREGFDIVDCHGLRETIAFTAARRRCTLVRSQHVTGKIKPGPRHRLVWETACDHVVATAARIKDELSSIGVPDHHVSVVGEWAADAFFRLDDKPRHRAEVRAEFGLPAEKPLIVNVGMLRHDKGQEHVIDAVALLRERGVDLVLLLVGGSTGQGPRRVDDHEALLRRRAAAHGLDARVIFTGYRNDVARLVQAADAQVVASVAVEGQSRTVPQAFAAQVPVIATTAGGLTELVVDGVTGRLVPPGDGAAIADTLVALLSEKSATAAMVAAAHRVALDALSLDAKMGETLALYRRLRSSRGDAPAGLWSYHKYSVSFLFRRVRSTT